LRGTSNIYSVHRNGKDTEKIKKLLKLGLIHMLNVYGVAIEDVHLNAFSSGALKMLKLWNCKMSSNQLVSLFKIFGTTKL